MKKILHFQTFKRIHDWFQGDRAHLPPSQTSFQLKSSRVAYFQLREYFLVSKKLKNKTEKPFQGPLTQHARQLKSSEELPVEEWKKPKEELFFVDRIIKCLLD